MGKNCVQAVGDTGRNSVDTLPHLPQLSTQQTFATAAVCTNTGSFTSFVRAEHTVIYTGKNEILSQLTSCFSPVSTPPITTTITYI